MNIQFVCYFTESEVSDLKSLLKEKTVSVNFYENPANQSYQGESNLIRTLVFLNNDYDFQQFINVCVSLGFNKISSQKI